MGFRFIRENTKEYEERLQRKKDEQLLTERRRWRHLTTRSDDDPALVTRYEQVRHRGQYFTSADQLAERLAAKIRHEALNIATIQGNLEIDRIQQLLKDTSDSR